MAVRSPEFPTTGVAWFNADAPLAMADLRGKVVLLDFWTLCCINCLHVLPTLARIEAAFPDSVAVIGVHSPKFPWEREEEAVRSAIARHDIRHPVLHDPDMKLWGQHAVRAWPTLVFIDPQGYVLGHISGEPDAARLTEVVGRLVSESDRLGVLDRAIPFSPPPEPSGGRFRFPAKIRPVSAGRWVLADTGHHQIVLLDDAGGELARFGSGTPGFDDGPAFAATFRDPQGVAADDAALWVADTGNHALRRIDLTTGTITTVAGTGARGKALGDAAPARNSALASPWDVVAFGGGVLFANAGTHQLGALDAEAGLSERLAGTGAEALVDGPADQAVLAQPSGLALAQGKLFFVDSETSSLRVLELETMQVRTLVGTGLFDFGHEDGPFAEARLQHPLGLAVLPDGDVVVADSYNHAVRLAEVESGVLRDLDDGFTCLDQLCLPAGGEPAGIAADPHAPANDPRLLLVETNRHRIMELRPARRTVRTWAA